MLHSDNIFPKLMHFSGIECYFCMFFFRKMKMRHRYIYILTVIATLMLYSVISSAQNIRPESAHENMLLKAVANYNVRDIKGAEAILKEIVSEDDRNDAAWYYLAMTSLAEGEIEIGEEYFRRAINIDGNNFWYRYRLARLYAMTGRPELATSMYEGLLEDFPKKSELYLDLVDLYSTQKEYDKALETIGEIEKIFGMTESIAMFRYNVLRTVGKEEEAYQALKDYNASYSSPSVLTTLADHEMESYNDTTALAYYEEALDIAPDYAPALLGKAEVQRMTRRYDGYFDTVGKLVQVDGVPVEGKTDYLMAVIQRTDPKFIRVYMHQMDTVIFKLIDKHPEDSTALQTAGAYFYSTSRNDMAGSMFRKNMEANPESYSAAATYVEFLMYAGQWKELSDEGRKAFTRFPKETSFLEMASMGDFYLGEYQKVLDICNQVIEVAPNDSSATLRAWSTIGDMHQDMGDYKKAYQAYEKALKINPDYSYVLNNYAYHLSMEGKKLKKACAMSKKTIEAEPDNSTYLDTYAWILYLMGKPEEAKPYFKHAMLYGGKDSVVILDHYAEVLYALEEYELAFVYWNMARQKNVDEIPDLEEKIERKKREARK